jgi:protein-disulfide isomerase
MRILSSSLLVAFFFSLAAVPTADAWVGSSLKASVTKYDIRAAAKAKRSMPKKTARPASVELPAIAKGGLLWGDPEATTTIVMFTDMECPFCRRFHELTFPALKKDYIDVKNVRFVVRHFPLSFHAYAGPAARAVVCARKQGDDKARTLYENLMTAKELNGAAIKDAIVAVPGIDAAIIEQCVAAADTQAVVDADFKAGTDSGISGTPSFLIIGSTGTTKTIRGAYPIASFVEAIGAVQTNK